MQTPPLPNCPTPISWRIWRTTGRCVRSQKERRRGQIQACIVVDIAPSRFDHPATLHLFSSGPHFFICITGREFTRMGTRGSLKFRCLFPVLDSFYPTIISMYATALKGNSHLQSLEPEEHKCPAATQWPTSALPQFAWAYKNVLYRKGALARCQQHR